MIERFVDGLIPCSRRSSDDKTARHAMDNNPTLMPQRTAPIEASYAAKPAVSSRSPSFLRAQNARVFTVFLGIPTISAISSIDFSW